MLFIYIYIYIYISKEIRSIAAVILSKCSFIYTNTENKIIPSKTHLKSQNINKFYKIQ